MKPNLRDKESHRNRAGLAVSRQIMKSWGIDDPAQFHILNIDHNLLDSPDVSKALTDEQLIRVSYLLNIHASLKELFQNPENHSGFMTAVNHNPPYNGLRPVDFVMTGEVDSLRKVFESLEQMKHGQW